MQNKGGISELAPPDLSVPSSIHGPDLRLAADDEPSVLPGMSCPAEHCRMMLPVLIPEGDIERAWAGVSNVLSRAVQGIQKWLRPSASGADAARGALSALRAGRSPGVKVVDSAEDLEKLFGRLSAGGKPIQGSSYPGKLVEFSDGTTVGLRGVSRSGGSTIDITLPGKEFWKVHIE